MKLSPLAKGQAKARAKAKGRPRGKKAAQPELDAEQEAQLKDDVIKGVILQVLKSAEALPLDDLKEHLYGKSTAGKGNSRLNPYWTKKSGGVKLACYPGSPEIGYFAPGTLA